MALFQKTIFLLCIASIYAGRISNILQSEPETSTSLTKNLTSLQTKSDEEIIDYNTSNPSFISFEDSKPQPGFEMGKSLMEALLGVFQIVRHMDLSNDGLMNVTLLAGRMLSLFAGQYLETLKNLMPIFSGMVMAILESLK